jgi:hypothetical protein
MTEHQTAMERPPIQRAARALSRLAVPMMVTADHAVGRLIVNYSSGRTVPQNWQGWPVEVRS